MKLTLTREMIESLDHAVDKPDWLIDRMDKLKTGPEPYVLQLRNEESTALEELCAMNIRFDEGGEVMPEHRPLDQLSLMIMEAY
ncbi:MAG: hypothetical protein ABI613_05250 [Gemmatimonadota bacterium]